MVEKIMGKIGDYSKWFPTQKITKPKVKQTQATYSAGNNIAQHLFDELGDIDVHVINLYRYYLIAKNLPKDHKDYYRLTMNPKMSLNVLNNKNRKVKFKV